MKPEKLYLLDRPTIQTVDSSSLMGYLLRQHPESKRFAERLNLEWLKPAMDFLVRNQQLTDFYDEEQKRLGRALGLSNEEIDRQVLGEIDGVVYFDKNRAEYLIGGLSFGGFGEVKGRLDEFYTEDTFPMMTIHTHPINSLPSLDDYGPLVNKIAEPNIREINSGLIICPNVQVLYLATPETPFLSDKEYERKLREFGEESNNGEGSLKSWKGLSVDEIREDIERTKGELAINPDAYNFWRLNNTLLLQAAREWRIRLYASIDKQNFIVFSD